MIFFRVINHRRIMPRVDVNEFARLQIQHSDKCRHEHHSFVIGAEFIVGGGNNFGKAVAIVRRYGEIFQHSLSGRLVPICL